MHQFRHDNWPKPNNFFQRVVDLLWSLPHRKGFFSRGTRKGILAGSEARCIRPLHQIGAALLGSQRSGFQDRPTERRAIFIDMAGELVASWARG